MHLSGDIRRAYSILITEWLAYMKHLKSDYPYLFSLAVRTNPFDQTAGRKCSDLKFKTGLKSWAGNCPGGGIRRPGFGPGTSAQQLYFLYSMA